jgi:parallel beta-helix repeat protein
VVFPNGANLIINGTAQATTIGGAALAERNLFGAANGIGTGLNVSSPNCYCVVRNSYIGTDYTGNGTRGNAGTGLQIYGSQHNLIVDNVISGNGSAGVQLVSSPALEAAHNTLHGNSIGLAANGSTVLGNGFAGIWLSTTALYNDIGNSAYWDLSGSNIIAGSNGPGVLVDSTASVGNSIFGNQIRANSGLAIDLDVQGPLANDLLDPDNGPNDLQNYPVVTRAIAISGSSMHVEGTLAATPGNYYSVNFYANLACASGGFGPAQIPIGGRAIGPADVAGKLAFSVDVGPSLLGIPSSGVITTTATNVNSSTSEISACHPYLPDEIFPDGFEPSGPPEKK